MQYRYALGTDPQRVRAGIRAHAMPPRRAGRIGRRRGRSVPGRAHHRRWRPAAPALYGLRVLVEKEATESRAHGGSPASQGGVCGDDRGVVLEIPTGLDSISNTVPPLVPF
jgi:hypothetical protein